MGPTRGQRAEQDEDADPGARESPPPPPPVEYTPYMDGVWAVERAMRATVRSLRGLRSPNGLIRSESPESWGSQEAQESQESQES
ncbi:hypothetical protein CYMTET_15648 [Cymbomonas tetramitiformis]|uniref:Uncharacterized protein n=1 Tax=Cymbomonas tetramitiformis TaxID=36881 RepID=A0AAE0GDU0_9CHLO|nr:hypothetical protein CYMTET_15648 [Cymbomonas tetramitiformis]